MAVAILRHTFKIVAQVLICLLVLEVASLFIIYLQVLGECINKEVLKCGRRKTHGDVKTAEKSCTRKMGWRSDDA